MIGSGVVYGDDRGGGLCSEAGKGGEFFLFFCFVSRFFCLCMWCLYKSISF